jgi:hypothetical protein
MLASLATGSTQRSERHIEARNIALSPEGMPSMRITDRRPLDEIDPRRGF